MARASTVSNIFISLSSTTIVAGQSVTLYCSVTFSDNTHGNSCAAADYIGVDAAPTAYPKTVNGVTTITGTSPGTTFVRVGYGANYMQLNITVKPPTAENLGSVRATDMSAGLGMNLHPTNAWEWPLAAALGVKMARVQCSWHLNEGQSAAPSDASTGYALGPDCAGVFSLAKANGMGLTIIAAYEPPSHKLLTVSVPGGAQVGATSFSVQFASAVNGSSVSNMRGKFDSLLGVSTPRGSGIAGSLIDSVSINDSTHATIKLASALAVALPANTSATYAVEEYLYAPPFTASPSDSSNMAYARYAQALGQMCASSGVSPCAVELWNEPPNSYSPWDNGGEFYDSYVGTVGGGVSILTNDIGNYGFAAAVQSLGTPSGFSYVWGASESQYAVNLLNGDMQAKTGVALAQPSGVFSSESIHPYGNNPEDKLYSRPCLQALAANGYQYGYQYQCNLFGVPGGANEPAARDIIAKTTLGANYGLNTSITETGANQAFDTAHRTRYVLRQFLGYGAAGALPIDFYRLYDTAETYGWVTSQTNVLPMYTAMAALMAEINSISSSTPVAYSAADLPAVVAYSGMSYPVDSAVIVGRRSVDSTNSYLLTVWQRSYSSHSWTTLPSPPAAPVTVSIASGKSVSSIRNLSTQAQVPFTTNNGQVTFSISDDPVEVKEVPN